MDNLRWILLLLGVVVLMAIYFSGRFESEGRAQERKQFRTGRHGKTGKKADWQEALARPPVVTVRGKVKKEPGMGEVDPELVAEPVSPTIPHDETVTLEPVTKANLEILAGHTDETVNLGHVDIEDEITGIEIPVDFAVTEAEIQIADTVPDEEPERAVIPPGIEPLVLSVSIFADEEENFSGPEIKEALEAEGLEYGAMRIFHFHDPDKKDISENDDAVFSVASVMEPGFFDQGKLDALQTPGLMLFCQLPGPLPGDIALEMMLDKGRGLAVRLHGHMCDDKRNRFTAQARNHYLDRIAAFNRELVLACKKTPTN